MKNEKLFRNLCDLRQKATQSGLSHNISYEILQRNILKRRSNIKKIISKSYVSYFVINSTYILIFICLFYQVARNTKGFNYNYVKHNILSNVCLMKTRRVREVFRPRFNCSVCSGKNYVTTVDDIDNITFLEKYAYSSEPLLIKGAAKSWQARSAFNYTFFKNIYTQFPEVHQCYKQGSCQYFRYGSKFKSLKDVFNMSDKEVNNEEESWYIGWSDRQTPTAEIMSKLYNNPSFLPSAEHEKDPNIVHWIFMGWSGGANIHIDNVKKPSWQAMMSGTKTWTLIPSVECTDICQTLKVTIEPGDILTVDTNNWHHSTYIHPGEMAISIGNEY